MQNSVQIRSEFYFTQMCDISGKVFGAIVVIVCRMDTTS